MSLQVMLSAPVLRKSDVEDRTNNPMFRCRTQTVREQLQ